MSIIFFGNLLQSDTYLREKFKFLINFKFRQIWIHLFIYAIYYVILDIFYALQLFSENHKKGYFAIVIIFSSILTMIEMIQYFSYEVGSQINFYNALDMLTLPMVIVMSVINLTTDNQNRVILIFELISLFLLNVRTLLELRVFKNFRYLLRVILNVFKSLGPFIVVTIIFIYIYACLLKGANRFKGEEVSVWKFLEPSFHLSYGQYDTGDSQEFNALDWIIFIFCGFILIILNLNLVIAIVN